MTRVRACWVFTVLRSARLLEKELQRPMAVKTGTQNPVRWFWLTGVPMMLVQGNQEKHEVLKLSIFHSLQGLWWIKEGEFEVHPVLGCSVRSCQEKDSRWRQNIVLLLALAWGTLEVERVLSGTGSGDWLPWLLLRWEILAGLRVCSLPLTQGLDPRSATSARGLVRRGGSQQTQEWRSPLTSVPARTGSPSGPEAARCPGS